jgi:hypothetical protein
VFSVFGGNLEIYDGLRLEYLNYFYSKLEYLALKSARLSSLSCLSTLLGLRIIYLIDFEC